MDVAAEHCVSLQIDAEQDDHLPCRILKSPIPLSFTRHTSRFLVIW